MKAATPILLLYILCLPFLTRAQEENAMAVTQGKKYLSLNIKFLDKYNKRAEKQQKRIVDKLQKREAKIAKKLKRKDPAAYARYADQPLTYDSIKRFMHSDSLTKAKKMPNRKNSGIDSLKGVASFTEAKAIDNKDNKGTTEVQSYKSALGQEQQKLNYHSYINDLISQRTQNLKKLSATSKSPIPGLTSIEKKAYYGKEKIQAYKDIAEEPTKGEDKALEYLQGTEGFDGSMDKAINGKSASLGNNENPADMLEKQGMQTKRQLQGSLQQKFGKDLGGVSDKLGNQFSQWQDKGKGLKANIDKVKATATTVQKSKQSVQQAKSMAHLDKPSFKVNPMRKLPFWQRIEKQYTWQTTRPTLDGKPAMFEGSAMAGFKQTEHLTYGVGIATSIGMGQGWTNLKLSFEGIGVKTFVNWKWQYGIGAYVGYERMYKSVVFTDKNEIITTTLEAHDTKIYSESVLVGLTKDYHLSDKWNGQLQVLYDIWWQQKGLRSPIMLRFATMKK